MLWARNKKKKKIRQCPYILYLLLWPNITQCPNKLHAPWPNQILGCLSGAVLLLTPFSLGENSAYLVLYLFFLVLVFFVCFLGLTLRNTGILFRLFIGSDSIWHGQLLSSLCFYYCWGDILLVFGALRCISTSVIFFK